MSSTSPCCHERGLNSHPQRRLLMPQRAPSTAARSNMYSAMLVCPASPPVRRRAGPAAAPHRRGRHLEVLRTKVVCKKRRAFGFSTAGRGGGERRAEVFAFRCVHICCSTTAQVAGYANGGKRSLSAVELFGRSLCLCVQ